MLQKRICNTSLGKFQRVLLSLCSLTDQAGERNPSSNVFVKPNEQNRAYSSYAMARKRRMKSNVFVKPNEQN